MLDAKQHMPKFTEVNWKVSYRLQNYFERVFSIRVLLLLLLQDQVSGLQKEDKWRAINLICFVKFHSISVMYLPISDYMKSLDLQSNSKHNTQVLLAFLVPVRSVASCEVQVCFSSQEPSDAIEQLEQVSASASTQAWFWSNKEYH